MVMRVSVPINLLCCIGVSYNQTTVVIHIVMHRVIVVTEIMLSSDDILQHAMIFEACCEGPHTVPLTLIDAKLLA